MNEFNLVDSDLEQNEVPPRGPVTIPDELYAVRRGWLCWDDERTERWQRDSKGLEKLAKSMKKRKGPTKPLLIAQEGTLKFRVIDGVGRVLAGDLLGLDEYDALVITDLEVAEGFLSLNLCRFDVDPVTLARQLKQVQFKTGYSHAQLGEIIGKSRESVTQILPIADLPDDVLAKALATKPMPPLSHFIQLASSEGAMQAEILTKITEGARRIEIRKLRSATIKKARPFKRSITAMIKRVDDAADILSGLGQVIDCNDDDAGKLADLKARIEKLLLSLEEKCRQANFMAVPMFAGLDSEAINSGGRDE